jgi:predicted amidohydrolase YtcJ
MKIIYNANIYTMNENNPTASAMAIGCNRILAIGTKDQIFKEFSYIKNQQNMNDRTIIPGLTDSHIHLMEYAEYLSKIDCEVPTKSECLNLIADQARLAVPGEWILGHGWNQNDWEGGYGTARDLDKVAPNNPVYLTSKSLHASWTNTLGLSLAEISKFTTDPPGGVIQRDHEGNPTGILLENATKLVSKILPDRSLNISQDIFLKAQETLISMGITGAHDFDKEACFKVLQALQIDQRLKLRIIKSIPKETFEEAVALGIRTGFGNDHLRIGGVKLFADGALGPHTAAMLDPYENDPMNRGMLLLGEEDVFEMGKKAVENGISLAIHAIGDRANREVLNGIERLRKIDKTLRHRIEHVQILHPADTHRLADSNIVASMQPVHVTSDMQMADDYWGERAAYSYAWNNQQKSGVVLAFGSDAPVESPNPFWGIHAAVTRRKFGETQSSKSWNPDQCVNVIQAIKGYTTGPAYAAQLEDRLGKLSPSYFADLLVLETDPFKCEAESIHEVGVMIDGEWVLRKF